ncbi:hypothetical protein APHAL10511_000667 [Amanita phalloides]|nr:hypothetical protein APHAL10511_000667 [Amanita phalloides]
MPDAHYNCCRQRTQPVTQLSFTLKGRCLAGAERVSKASAKAKSSHAPQQTLQGDKNDRPATLFRTALDPGRLRDGEISLPLITLREFTMQRIMNIITDKPSWHTKVLDKKVVSKWKDEFLNAKDLDVTQAMMDWCIEELLCKAQIFKKSGLITVYDSGVIKSDTAVPEELRQALLAAAKPLESVPDKDKDWHPKTDEKILDLVHPSLFPLVYGQSRVLPNSVTSLDDCISRCGEGEVADLQLKPDADVPENYSRRFQWLPCDIDISDNQVKIKSYINNLHPQKYKDLYGIIEQIIELAIPLWNTTLSALNSIDGQFRRITYTEAEFEKKSDQKEKGEGKAAVEEDDIDKDDDQEVEDADHNSDWEDQDSDEDEEENIRYIQPEPGTFNPDVTVNNDAVDLWSEHGQTGLQVIVKLANIHLTPNKPEYEGGSWHVEGQMNEHICASAIYYYDSENITTSSLAFRQQSQDDSSNDIDYEQNHHRWLTEVFGCHQEGPTVQNVGSVDTNQGRMITFPNIFQHQVQPFRLQDPTKPGHRKILAFFLVDPNIKIVSTANVPCQRIDWWQEIATETPQISKLPREIQDHIFRLVPGFPMSMDDAKELRLELMDERTAARGEVDEAFHASTFNLCEH